MQTVVAERGQDSGNGTSTIEIKFVKVLKLDQGLIGAWGLLFVVIAAL